MQRIIFSFLLFMLSIGFALGQCPSNCNGLNVLMGSNAGNSLNGGNYNTFLGRYAGSLTTTAGQNTFVGDFAGKNNTSGHSNTFMGENSGLSNTTASSNTFIGKSAGEQNTIGAFNTFIGERTGYSNTLAFYNTFIGAHAGYFNTDGENNTFIGFRSGENNTTGFDNTFVGEQSGKDNNTGSQNTFLGRQSGLHNTDGYYNTFLGAWSGESNVGGYYNTFLGTSSGGSNTSGFHNTFIGTGAGTSNITGTDNTFLGRASGYFSKGLDNTFIGTESGYNISTGNQNTFLGKGTGYNNTQGSANVFLGWYAGYYETGSHKLYIANDSIGTPLIYGEFDNHKLGVNASLGVGIQHPERTLHLRNLNTTTPTLRIDGANADPGIALASYDTGFNNLQKSFYMFTRSTGANTGRFVIADTETGIDEVIANKVRFVIDNQGNVGIGDYLSATLSQKLEVAGDALINGVFISSDKRYKQNIHHIPEALTSLEKLHGVSYEYKTAKFERRNFQKGKTLGFIAQEVEKVFPELVVEDAEGYKAVNYIGLIPVLVEAIKEQNAKIKSMEMQLQLQNVQHTKPSIQQPQLFQNKPNPFDQSTEIAYVLPDGVNNALILITDLQGKEIKRLPILKWGSGSVSLKAGNLSKGIYLYTLIVNGKLQDTKRMLIE